MAYHIKGRTSVYTHQHHHLFSLVKYYRIIQLITMHLLSAFLSAAALATAVNAITFQTCQAKDFNNCKARMKINLGECCLPLYYLSTQKLCLLIVLR